MATNDIQLLSSPVFGSNGSVRHNVGASSTLIYPGEPVARAQGGVVVTPMATNKPVVKTDYLAGVAVSTSTNTASAAGYVDVQPLVPGQVWLIKPNVAASWDTQAEYDALVGKRVLIDLTSTSYTILAADSATNGCIVMPLDITRYPGKVAFAFDSNVSDLSFQD